MLLPGCSGGGQTSATSGAGNSGVFFFSSQPPQNSSKGLPEWCRGQFPNPVVLNAEPDNFNRRIFSFGNGPYKVTVSFGNIVAAFVLQRVGGQVEIFTSKSFPECLSNEGNFTIHNETSSFKYDNLKDIHFNVELVNAAGVPSIVIDMGKDAPYGIEVRK